MRFDSSRHQAPTAGFSQALLQGLAPDGGLYVPEKIPAFTTPEIASMRGQSYTDLAYAIIDPRLRVVR